LFSIIVTATSIIIIIIIIIVTYTHGICNYVHETKHFSRVYNFAALL
jgi:hypothetical protein